MEQIVQISVIFISNKSIIIEIKDSNHVSLTSNISAKTWSNWTCRVCFVNVKTSRFQICPWFWKSTKICGSNRAKRNIQLFLFLPYCIERDFLSCFPIEPFPLYLTWISTDQTYGKLGAKCTISSPDRVNYKKIYLGAVLSLCHWL